MFATVIHNLKSAENTGLIVRNHVAMGGDCIVIVGPEPWRFRKGTQAFSRKLEKLCEVVHVEGDDELLEWCATRAFTPIAVEIVSPPTYLPGFTFPERPAIIVGNEGVGLPESLISRCHGVVTIPQFGPVGSLNVAMSCGVVTYEFMRSKPVERPLKDHKFDVDKAQRRVGA